MEDPETKKDLYTQYQIREIKQRLETLEAQMRALQVNPTNNSGFYTVKEAAAVMGVDKQTINRWRRAGKIKSFKEGKVVRIPKTEILEMFSL